MTGISQSTGLCERLEWDSRFFGVSIARVRPSRLDRAGCTEVVAWCRAERIDCLYFLADTDDAGTRQTMDEAGFERVDERVTLQLPRVPAGAAAPQDTRAAQESDIPALREIAARSHRDSRFYFDGRFDRDRCDEFYRVWIEKSCRGWADHVVVAERHGVPAGYLTLHLKGEGLASIGLLGVDSALRRQGIGRQLIDGALAWLAGEGSAARVSVVTQGRNDTSQRFYRSAGFVPAEVAVWYHRWFRPQPDRAR